jgi:Protein of unknown function (DUF3467)
VRRRRSIGGIERATAFLCMEQPAEPPLEGRYANVFRVGHNPVEFVFDFGQFFPTGKEQLHTRIITSPLHAREFLRVLRESVDAFEHECGPIAAPPGK